MRSVSSVPGGKSADGEGMAGGGELGGGRDSSKVGGLAGGVIG